MLNQDRPTWDIKTAENAKSAEEEGRRGISNYSDTNGFDMIRSLEIMKGLYCSCQKTSWQT